MGLELLTDDYRLFKITYFVPNLQIERFGDAVGDACEMMELFREICPLLTYTTMPVVGDMKDFGKGAIGG